MALHWRRTGPTSDLPLVLLHALPLDSSMWDEMRGELSDVDVLTVDAPGFGGSPSGSDLQRDYEYPEPSLSVYVDALRSCLRARGVDRVVLGGLSMGGAVAAAFTLRHPDMVAGLVLMDTNIAADPQGEDNPRNRAIALCDEGRGNEAVAAWSTTMVSPLASQGVRDALAAQLSRVDSVALGWIQRAMRDREDATGAVSAVEGPVLLVRGSDDPTCKPQTISALQEKRPTARIVEIPAAGHFVANERPRELAALLGDFYAQVESA